MACGTQRYALGEMVDHQPMTPLAQLMLDLYADGVFAMAESADDPNVYWLNPQSRGIIPLDGFLISRSTRRMMCKMALHVRINDNFSDIVRACADRPVTWINAKLFDLYHQLHAAGYAHSLSVYDGQQRLGGVFGVALGGAFFGESMFSDRTNGSKIALAYLTARLRYGGFSVFDTQFITDHLASLGAIEITRAEYQQRLQPALKMNANFMALSPSASAYDVIHLSTQTS